MMQIENRYYLSRNGNPPFAGTITFQLLNGGAKRTIGFSLPDDNEDYYEVNEAVYNAEVARLAQIEKDTLDTAKHAQREALAASYEQRKTDYELLIGMGMSPSVASKMTSYKPDIV